jgi:hypothetical protein
MLAPSPTTVTRRMPDREYCASSEVHAIRDVRGFSTMLGHAYELKAGQSTTIVFSINSRRFVQSSSIARWCRSPQRRSPSALSR